MLIDDTGLGGSFQPASPQLNPFAGDFGPFQGPLQYPAQAKTLTEQDFQFYNQQHAPAGYVDWGRDAQLQFQQYMANQGPWAGKTDDEIRGMLGLTTATPQQKAAFAQAASTQGSDLAHFQDVESQKGDMDPAQIALLVAAIAAAAYTGGSSLGLLGEEIGAGGLAALGEGAGAAGPGILGSEAGAGWLAGLPEVLPEAFSAEAALPAATVPTALPALPTGTPAALPELTPGPIEGLPPTGTPPAAPVVPQVAPVVPTAPVPEAPIPPVAPEVPVAPVAPITPGPIEGLPPVGDAPITPGPIEGLPPVGDAPVVPPVTPELPGAPVAPAEPIPRVTVTADPLPIGAPVVPEVPLPVPTLPPPVLPIPPLPTEVPADPNIDPGTGLPKIPPVLPKLPGDKTTPKTPVGDAVDLVGKFGPSVLGIGGLLANQQKSKAYADQLAALGGPQRETATRQLADANAGKINAADQWRIDQYKQDSTTRAQQFYSKAGIPDSTQLVGTLNDVGARSAAMFEETRQAMMKSAMTELDTLDNGTRASIKMEMEADAAAQKAISEFMASMAKLFTGSNAKSLGDAAGGVSDWLKKITGGTPTGTDTTSDDTTTVDMTDTGADPTLVDNSDFSEFPGVT